MTPPRTLDTDTTQREEVRSLLEAEQPQLFPDYSQEAAENARYLLKTTEIAQHKHGKEVPRQVWERVFGDENLVRFLEAALVDDGDFIVAKGSAVLASIHGGYKMDPKTGLILPGQVTDFDFFAPNEITSRLSMPEIPATELPGVTGASYGRNALKLTLEGDLKVDITNIAALAQSYRNSVSDFVAYAAVNFGDDMQVQQDISRLNDLDFDWQDPEKFLRYSAYLKQDMAGYVFKKKNGQITAYFCDPQDTIADEAELELRKQALGITMFVGTTFDGTNELSVQSQLLGMALYMRAVKSRQQLPFELADKFVAFEFGKMPATLMRVFAERDTQIRADIQAVRVQAQDNPGQDPSGPEIDNYTQYLELHALCRWVSQACQNVHTVETASDQEPLQTKDPFFGEAITTIKRKSQEQMVRALTSSTFYSAQMLMSYYPIGQLLHPVLQDRISAQVTNLLPDNELYLGLMANPDIESSVDDVFERAGFKNADVAPKVLEDMIVFYFKLGHLVANYYGQTNVLMDKGTLYDAVEDYPKSISEMMALFIVAGDYDLQSPDSLETLSTQAAENWLPKGQVALPWSKSDTQAFDMTFNNSDFVRYVQEFRNYLDSHDDEIVAFEE